MANHDDECPVCEGPCGFYDDGEGLCRELLRLSERQNAVDQATTEFLGLLYVAQERGKRRVH
ncbi:hypothetical protein CLV88_1311 [Shimia abyssi]|uniref:Uncharacterized protein n=1 Tax=Shimia abyssi TaxID=1662395 RepID=A0A2P8EWE7_9RHOB|nr:hypothetical protein CLV88_1311 [Shimia abyssi]